MTLPRLLVLMGSGETSPTMVKTHRRVFERLGAASPAVLLDTPFGFQENADELVARAQAYFAESIGVRLELASYRSGADADELATARFLAQVRGASFVFAGPGSPTYALAQWQAAGLRTVLEDKLAHGGAVTFASAAVLTLGIATVPVYEIYKVGEAPAWRQGLDVLAGLGIPAAVIPHYDNAEGGTHDTRFCYLGERRLRAMEPHLPSGTFVLGLDEHTGLVLDLDRRRAEVVGRGGVTVRVAGRSEVLPTGTELSVDDLAEVAARLRQSASYRPVAGASGGPVGGGGREETSDPDAGSGPAPRNAGVDDGTPASGDGRELAPGEPSAPLRRLSPLAEALQAHGSAFDAALAARQVDTAVAAILAVERELDAWEADTLESDDRTRGRTLLRSMITRLGDLAEVGARDPAELVGPFVEGLLELRRAARAARRYEDADQVRDLLVRLRVEVRDAPEGTTWLLRDTDAGGVPPAGAAVGQAARSGG